MSKVVWLSSPNGPNDNHKSYINALKHDLYFTNTYLKNFEESPSKIKRYISWIVNAIFFKNAKKYSLFVSIGEHAHLPLMKRFGLLSKNQKIMCFHCTETLYFLKENRYSSSTKKFLIWLINQFDVHLCVSQMTASLLKELTNKTKFIYPIYNGVPIKQQDSLFPVEPDLSSYTITFVGNLYSDWRLWYKGVDLLLKSISVLRKKNPNVRLIIIGYFEDSIIEKFEKELDEKLTYVDFVGKTSELSKYFSKSSLYLHPARGEAFGISVLEAMAAGVPTLISEWTGAKEVVEKVSRDFIFSLEVEKIIEKVEWYFSLPIEQKINLSKKFKEIAKDYTQQKSIENLKNTFDLIFKELKLS